MREDIDDEVMLERIRCFSHWGGRASSLEEVAAEAKETAGEAFANDRITEANFWRAVAGWLEEKAKAERKKQQEFLSKPTPRP